MANCEQCGKSLYHHICYYCGWDNDRDITIVNKLAEKKLQKLARKTLDAKDKICEKCKSKIHSYKCYYCGWNHKLQTAQRVNRPNYHEKLPEETYVDRIIEIVGRTKKTIGDKWKRKRHRIYKRDGYACVVCDTKDNLTLDHRFPKSKGGTESYNNLITMCKSCNEEKADRYFPLDHYTYKIYNGKTHIMGYRSGMSMTVAQISKDMDKMRTN